MIYINCVTCGRKFESKVWNKKSCSKECNRIYRRKTRKLIEVKNAKKRICAFCGETFYRYVSRNENLEFCSRSCGSKYHIKLGTFDNWCYRIQEKVGKTLKCLMCESEFYVKPCHLNDGKNKFCSRKCFGEHRTEYYTGSFSPNFGNKASKETKEKQKNTLLKRYGVVNAYMLSKRRKVSRPQLDIYEHLLNEGFDPVKEKKINNFFVDIMLEKKKICIEFNGEYWHCDPRSYSEDYFNKKKGLYARDIWKSDENRYNILNKEGYDVIVIWEKEYREDREKLFINLKGLINEKDKSVGNFRPSVKCIADVKLRELLETPDSSDHYSIIGNDKCDMFKKHQKLDNQQPSSCSEKMEKVQRLEVRLTSSIEHGNNSSVSAGHSN